MKEARVVEGVAGFCGWVGLEADVADDDGGLGGAGERRHALRGTAGRVFEGRGRFGPDDEVGWRGDGRVGVCSFGGRLLRMR